MNAKKSINKNRGKNEKKTQLEILIENEKEKIELIKKFLNRRNIPDDIEDKIVRIIQKKRTLPPYMIKNK